MFFRYSGDVLHRSNDSTDQWWPMKGLYRKHDWAAGIRVRRETEMSTRGHRQKNEGMALENEQKTAENYTKLQMNQPPHRNALNYSGFSHAAEMNEAHKSVNKELNSVYQILLPRAESDSFSSIVP